MAFLKLENVGKVYGTGENRYEALKDIDLEINRGEFVAIMGQSGSGKTTLLNIIGGLDNPTSGRVIVNGSDISQKNKSALSRYRRRDIGVIFQQYNLIRVLNVRENIELQVKLDHKKPNKKEIDYIVEKLGLSDKQHRFPDELSGGQQQRVAIGRAIATKPMLLLADEPTGNLDSETGKEIMNLIAGISKEENQTVILITHNEEIAEYADRVIRIKDGRIEEDN